MMVSVSIVSHGQLSLVQLLLEDIQKFCSDAVEVILTLNLPEAVPASFVSYTFPLQIIANETPKGFAANHNAAFKCATQPYYCVLNPDIRLLGNPFPLLLQDLHEKGVGVVAPLVVCPAGSIEDTARKFLTPIKLLNRVFIKKSGRDYDMTKRKVYPDWVAGMFMLFTSEMYKTIRGFDENYFLYCEDMDLCSRLRKQNYQVVLNTDTKVIHAARRHSHFKPKYFIWHCQSLLRYFLRTA
jgi:N-acetylglucosaminyl-diphospho-decaprenol L-rhamnosyltransferase